MCQTMHACERLAAAPDWQQLRGALALLPAHLLLTTMALHFQGPWAAVAPAQAGVAPAHGQGHIVGCRTARASRRLGVGCSPGMAGKAPASFGGMVGWTRGVVGGMPEKANQRHAVPHRLSAPQEREGSRGASGNRGLRPPPPHAASPAAAAPAAAAPAQQPRGMASLPTAAAWCPLTRAAGAAQQWEGQQETGRHPPDACGQTALVELAGQAELAALEAQAAPPLQPVTTAIAPPAAAVLKGPAPAAAAAAAAPARQPLVTQWHPAAAAWHRLAPAAGAALRGACPQAALAESAAGTVLAVAADAGAPQTHEETPETPTARSAAAAGHAASSDRIPAEPSQPGQ